MFCYHTSHLHDPTLIPLLLHPRLCLHNRTLPRLFRPLRLARPRPHILPKLVIHVDRLGVVGVIPLQRLFEDGRVDSVFLDVMAV